MSAGAPTPASALGRFLATRPEAVAGAALLAVCLVAAVAGRSLPWGGLTRPGAGLFPRALTLLLAILATALLLRGLRRPGAGVGREPADRAGLRRVLVMSGALAGYAAAVGTAGYLLTTAALFAVMVRGVGGRGWRLTLLASAIGSVGSYLIFGRLLRVPLPTGLWLP